MRAPKFEKKTTFELLADAIEAQIRQEGWGGLIPSGRDLANRHKVSLPTVQKAITLLKERKVLVSRGNKRRMQIGPGLTAVGHASRRGPRVLHGAAHFL